ncbi:AAA family ATPase [Parasphingorhabdus sp.]|uniref:AAA family ATPase n=1 Tax=Parasphingorhabdus sp. TaxID=2709688 RepID=UPI0032635ED6
MNEFQIARSMLLHMGKNAAAEAPIAKALLEWSLNNMGWLDLGVRKKKMKNWAALMEAIRHWRLPETPTPYVMQLADGLADILALNEQDHVLLALLIACDRLPRINALVGIASSSGLDLPILLGELSGAECHDAIRFVRRSPVMRLGLVGFQADRYGETRIEVQWALEKLLDRAPALGENLVDALVGPRQSTALEFVDFEHVDDAPFMRDLIAGTAKEQARGINILIHGPPGTGKTELARVLATAANVRLHAVGEVDEDGEEPDRYDRVNALTLAQRVLDGKSDVMLLFDEMEDFIGNARPGGGDWMAQRDGSKVFVNRLLETNAIPIIWTTNAIGNVDDAIIRRMSYVLKLDYPSRKTSTRIYARVARDEEVAVSPAVQRLVETAPETATVLRTAARATRLAGAKSESSQSATSLVKALRRGELPIAHNSPIDMTLYQSDPPLAPLIEQIANGQFLDVSLLLSGPPGTGKTALAHHFARKMDKPLLEKRASDLLSKWVGETEANIANAFMDAHKNQGILFFDEADSLMFDRASANANWEVGQVNELLSWLDRHDFPVLAATNNAARLDPATLRRFDFKVELKPLGGILLERAFRKFFDINPPSDLSDIRNLTPGDFAVVKRQLRHQPKQDGNAILTALQHESELKPESSQRIGF